jgi:NTE family protein
VAVHPALAASPLLTGLDEVQLEAVQALMRERQFEAGEEICHGGEPADAVWILTSGLVHWFVATTEGAGDLLMRLRKGDVIGAQDALAGETRTATVVASITTTALELQAADLHELARRFPQILVNVVRTVRERLFRANARSAENDQGEEVGLVHGPSPQAVIAPLVVAARAVTPRQVTIMDRRLSFAGVLTAADEAATKNGTVLVPGELDAAAIEPLLEEVDRVVALVGTAEEAHRLGELSTAARGHLLEVVVVGDEAAAAVRSWPAEARMRVVRTCPRGREFPLTNMDLAWVARHVTRTKLGIALGAGGAKGYAHVGVLQVLEENGYVVDYAGGSSIGGFVATHVAMGHDAAGVEAIFRAAFNEENVSALFSSPFGGGSKGLEALTRLLREATEDKSFADTIIPLVIMAVDLTARVEAPLRDGPVWEALLAALAVAGVFPPQERDGHRLVDGLALVPVPTAAVVEDGADIVISVNLMGAQTLEQWPEGPALEEAPQKKRRGMLDTLLEVMDLSQLDTSARHAALADVVLTPKFAPSDWRDFDLAHLFLGAGRTAALDGLPALKDLVRPIDADAIRRESFIGTLG